jgi:hypothetical protein
MKVRIATLILIVAAGWLALETRAKSKYEQARQAVDVAYSVTPINRQTITFMAEVQSNWTCWEDITNGADSEALKLAGKTPSVRNLIEMFDYRMPPYRWFSPSKNREAATLSLIKAKFMPISLDKQWHESADEHTAFLLCKSNVVALYRDEPSGLRASYYVEKKGGAMPPNTALGPKAAGP